MKSASYNQELTGTKRLSYYCAPVIAISGISLAIVNDDKWMTWILTSICWISFLFIKSQAAFPNGIDSVHDLDLAIKR